MKQKSISIFMFAIFLCASYSYAQMGGGCHANFYSHNINGNNDVAFAPSFNGPHAVYAWDFGDGSTSSQNTPVHTYAQAGAYFACLSVSIADSAGNIICSDNWCDSIHAGPPPPPVIICNAHFDVHHQWNSDTLRFEGANNHGGTTYAWDFGDGTTGTGHDVSHFYSVAGVYYACLTVTTVDTAGAVICTATSCDSVHAGPPPPPPIICNAHYGVHHLWNSDTLRFDASHNNPGTTYAWDFGDGSTGTGEHALYAYASAGVYYVCLTVTNTDSTGAVVCTDTWCDSVHVGIGPAPQPCNAHFRWNKIWNSDTLRFGTRPAMNSTFSWDLGDGTTETGPTITHHYALPGVYYVCLTVTHTDSTGAVVCTATWCDSVNTAGHFGHHHPHHHHQMININNNETMNPSVEKTSGIIDPAMTGSLSATVFPNPVNESSVIRIQNVMSKVILRVYDSNGKLVDEKEYSSSQDYNINKSSLQSGIYFYQVMDEVSVVKGSFIISRR